MAPSFLLAIVADLYTPLLGVFYLLRLRQAGRAIRRPLLCVLLLNLVIAWGLMFAEHYWHMWRAWSLDYSTHTAVALAFIVCLCFSSPHQTAYWAASLAAYAGIMIVLGYHSVHDIASTALVTGALMLPPGLGYYRASRSGSSPFRKR